MAGRPGLSGRLLLATLGLAKGSFQRFRVWGNHRALKDLKSLFLGPELLERFSLRGFPSLSFRGCPNTQTSQLQGLSPATRTPHDTKPQHLQNPLETLILCNSPPCTKKDGFQPGDGPIVTTTTTTSTTTVEGAGET